MRVATPAWSCIPSPTIAKISIVGLGMKDHAAVASRMFQVLADEAINIQLIATSEIKVSVVIHCPPPGQPLTLGGSKRSCPNPRPALANKRPLPIGISGVRTVPTSSSTGDLI